MRKDKTNGEAKFFNRIFKRWGQEYFVKDWLIEYLGFKKVKPDKRRKTRLLEVGCGVGRHSLELAELGYRVTGLDIAKEGICLARKKAQKEGLKARFICADVLRNNLPNASFDIILFIDSLHHFYYEGFNQILKEIERLLKSGGQLILVEPNYLYPFNYFSSNLAHFYKKYFGESRFSRLVEMVTLNERPLDPFQLRRLLGKHYRLLDLEFFLYFQFISKAIPLEGISFLKWIRRLVDRFCLFLPVRFRGDHFLMKLRER